MTLLKLPVGDIEFEMTKAFRILKPILKNLSFKAALYAFGAVFASLVAVFFAPYVPDSLAELLGGSAVDRILAIMASSMLAVVTFSLSTLVTSYATAASIASPRATALIMEDSSARNTLSAFLGAFIFSVVSMVALSTKYYGEKGRVILFIVTTGVLVLIILAMIKWIGQLSQYSLLTNLIERIERKAEATIAKNIHFFDFDDRAVAVSRTFTAQLKSVKSGFVRFIDLDQLSKVADRRQIRIHVETVVGRYVLPQDLIISFEGDIGTDVEQKEVLGCVEIGSDRELDNDPRFAFVVLSEIGSKALSPGINDPGTAIQILTSLAKLILVSKNEASESTRIECSKRLSFRKISSDEVFEDSFHAIARDGAGVIEVIVFLQRILQSFAADPAMSESAKRMARYSYDLSRIGLKVTRDMDRVRMIYENSAAVGTV
ncbi:DUF2254 domain-containing protein [soil metagenome]